MVYYGAASRGCELCRKRKVKCDEQVPQCQKCTKLGAVCPGYRDLKDVLFRDESHRIIKNAQRLAEVPARPCPTSSGGSNAADAGTPAAPALSSQLRISQPVEEVGANFFFSKYGFDLPPFFHGYTSWLSQGYFSGNPILTPIVEAVGMAGLSNTTNAPMIMSQAKERYQQSIARVKEAFNDPMERLTDEMFMSVLLLAFFETVSFENWDRYRNWLEHVQAATALLELRGKAQFTRAIGAQLFFLVRTQILSACMFNRLSVPPALVQASWHFATGTIREQLKAHHVASPGSMSEISLRLVNLRAAAKTGPVQMQQVREAARAIDNDLMMWYDVVPKEWKYATIEGVGERCFNGKQHVYNLPWAGEVWNNWRLLRITAHQIMLQDVEDESNNAAAQTIRQMSEAICMAVSAFTDYPRILSLIRPLYIVATESRNAHHVRSFALQQLRRVGVEMGVRHAVLVADTIRPYIDAPDATAGGAIDCESIPLTAPY